METNYALLLLGKLGPPLFGGTLVACLLAWKFEWLHAVLLGSGFLALSLDVYITRRARLSDLTSHTSAPPASSRNGTIA